LSDNLHSEKEFVQEQYEQMLLAHQQDETVLVSHYGELSQSVISNLEGNVEEKITSLEISKGPIKKIFFISVETLQNMLIHGQKTNEGEQHNFFILAKNTVNIQIISANLVSNTSIPSLEKQVNVINSFEDEKSLKAYYLEHLENNTLSEKGGAGLGFITIAMKSGNKLSVDFQKINEQFSLFTLTSAVNLA
jgi:hypothetical protein